METNCAVYCVINIFNNRKYVGSTTVFSRRRNQHLSALRHNKHNSHLMQSDFNEMGEDAFRFFVLEKVISKSKLLLLEQHWIDTLNPEYNVNRFAGSVLPEGAAELGREKRIASLTGRIQSQEEKDKRSASLREHWKTHKLIRSPEQRKHLSEINTGKLNPNYGLKRSDETRKKIADSNSKVLWAGFVSPNGTKYENIRNLTSFCKEHNLSQSCMSRVGHGIEKQHKGWKKLDASEVDFQSSTSPQFTVQTLD